MINKNFYPTPEHLIAKMVGKIEKLHNVDSILEPSAGRGDIIEYINEKEKYGRAKEISAIEIDTELQATLRGKNINLIDSDFLKYSGREHFDLIIANFPFDNGEKHLLKAIEILFNGQIVCLINAETIRNTCTLARKSLLHKLKSLDAEIEFISGAFIDADRKTDVEVALIYINKTETVETKLFGDMEHEDEEDFSIGEEKGLRKKDDIGNMIIEYTTTRDNVIEQLISFYKNNHLVNGYLELSIKGKGTNDGKNLTQLMKNDINSFIKQLKKDYWRKVTELKGVKERLTSKKREEFDCEITKYETLDFTESNIKQFIINVIENFPKMIDAAVEHLFDEFTKYGLREDDWAVEYGNNIHFYNAWKTNSGYKVNKKIILPIYYGYDKKIELDYKHSDLLNDIDRVISYFTDKPIEKYSYELCREEIDGGVTKKISTEYFLITFYKKGTMHLEFKDKDILRIFNIHGGKLKNFLPDDYGEKEYKDMCEVEKVMVDNFESKKEYKATPKKIPILSNFIKNNLPQITMEECNGD